MTDNKDKTTDQLIDDAYTRMQRYAKKLVRQRIAELRAELLEDLDNNKKPEAKD